MTRSHRIAWLATVGLVFSACSSGSPGPSGEAATPPSDTSSTSEPPPPLTPNSTPAIPDDALLPNLVMEPLDEWRIELRDGRRLLRVTTVFSNDGEGPFELRGSRASSDEPVMSMDQIVYTAGGGFRRVHDVIEAHYAGDGHEHWHAQRVVTMELRPMLNPAALQIGNKIHFCFFDSRRTNEDLEEFKSTGFYQIAWCGTPDAYSVRMGVSVGWGDRYGWDFEGQWIDITGMAGGTYTLQATVDAGNDLYETDDTDNCTMSTIQIPAAGEGRIVTVEANNQPCS